MALDVLRRHHSIVSESSEDVETGDAAECGKADDDRVVVRGGVSDLQSLRVAFSNSVDDTGRFELSVVVGRPGETVRDVSLRQRLLRGYGKVRQSTMSRLRAAGYVPVDCQPSGHCQIVFSEEPTDEELAWFMAAFGAPEPNPARRMNR